MILDNEAIVRIIETAIATGSPIHISIVGEVAEINILGREAPEEINECTQTAETGYTTSV